VKPDVVIELGWRANLMDFAMPFMINTICEQNRKVFSHPTPTDLALNIGDMGRGEKEGGAGTTKGGR
jgi:hypothetical protein